jgi:site-specific DNA-adenine methylase
METQVLGSKQNKPASRTEYLSEVNEGIYLIGDHAKMIWQGNKTVIMQSRIFENTKGKDLYLIGNNLCYGIIKINSITPVSIEEFRTLSSEHKITEKEREEWWSGKKQLYAYKFDFKKFETPKRVAVPQTSETFLKDVKFLSEEELIKDINEYDPSEINTNILKDDFRIALAWWANKKIGKNVKYSFEEIENLLQLIIQELLDRGIVFHPEKMLPSSKVVFEKVWNKIESLSEYEILMAQAFGSPGGKSRVSAKLNSMMPKHKVYVEAFAGGAALFWKKEPCEVEVLNDADPEIANAYRFIKSATTSEIVSMKKRKWSSDKSLFFRLLKSNPESISDKFYKFAYTHGFSYGFNRQSFGYNERELGICNRIPNLAERLKNVRIRNEDYKKVIQEFDSPNTFFFLDPPYPGEWPGKSGVNAWKEKDIKEMSELLHNIKGKFLLTINNLPWIKNSFTGFKQDSFFVPRTFRKGDKPKKELLISNYDIRSVNLSEIPSFASKFSDAVLIKDFVSIVGSSVEKDSYNDIDILIRLSNPTDFLKRAIETRIEKEYDDKKKLHFIWGDSEGPHDSFVPIFDLKLAKLEPKVVSMSEGITPMVSFNPMKPGKRFYNIEKTLDYLFGGTNVG